MSNAGYNAICERCYAFKPKCKAVWWSAAGYAGCTHKGSPISVCLDCRRVSKGRYRLTKRPAFVASFLEPFTDFLASATPQDSAPSSVPPATAGLHLP